MEFKGGKKAFSNNILSEINKSHVDYFILGDLNTSTNIFSMASNYSSDYLNMLTSNSVTSLIIKPTRVTHSTTTIIHRVLTYENCLKHYSLVIKYTLTHHYPFKISSQKTNNTFKNQYKLVRSFSKFSVKEFIKYLQKNLINFGKKIPPITDN